MKKIIAYIVVVIAFALQSIAIAPQLSTANNQLSAKHALRPMSFRKSGLTPDTIAVVGGVDTKFQTNAALELIQAKVDKHLEQIRVGVNRAQQRYDFADIQISKRKTYYHGIALLYESFTMFDSCSVTAINFWRETAIPDLSRTCDEIISQGRGPTADELEKITSVSNIFFEEMAFFANTLRRSIWELIQNPSIGKREGPSMIALCKAHLSAIGSLFSAINRLKCDLGLMSQTAARIQALDRLIDDYCWENNVRFNSHADNNSEKVTMIFPARETPVPGNILKTVSFENISDRLDRIESIERFLRDVLLQGLADIYGNAPPTDASQADEVVTVLQIILVTFRPIERFLINRLGEVSADCEDIQATYHPALEKRDLSILNQKLIPKASDLVALLLSDGDRLKGLGYDEGYIKKTTPIATFYRSGDPSDDSESDVMLAPPCLQSSARGPLPDKDSVAASPDIIRLDFRRSVSVLRFCDQAA